jgi:hypothetical protein
LFVHQQCNAMQCNAMTDVRSSGLSRLPLLYYC